jgi:conjugal transfer pilus assembly protein TraB
VDQGWHGVNCLRGKGIKMNDNLKHQLFAKILIFKEALKKRSVMVGIAIITIFILYTLSSTEGNTQSHQLVANTVPFENKNTQMTGLKESIDPRDVWTAKLEQKLEASNAGFQQKLEEVSQSKESELSKVQAELHELKTLLIKQQEIMNHRELEESLRQSNSIHLTQESNQPRSIAKSLGAFNKEYSSKKKNIKNYVTSGTFARAVLMTGVVVGTGSNSQSNPEPVMIRLTDSGIFSKGKRTEQIKEAILIGDCSGDLSSERAKCRLQTLSIENNRGEIIERSIQGWIVGEDGRNGVKGMVVDKSSDLLRMAMLNGVLGGMSNFLQNQSTKGIFPISPIAGQQHAMSGMSQLKGGAASGASDAFSKMADFVMDRFNSMSPQIVIASGREVDVVFQHGIDLNGELDAAALQNSDGNLGTNYNTPPKPITAQSAAYQETMQQMNKNIKHENDRDSF